MNCGACRLSNRLIPDEDQFGITQSTKGRSRDVLARALSPAWSESVISTARFHLQSIGRGVSSLGNTFMELTGGAIPGADRAAWSLTAGLCILFGILFFRVLFVDNAVVFGDEFAYKALSDHLIDQTLLLQRGDVTLSHNQLYLLVIGVSSWFSENAYVVAGLLNVLAYLLAAAPLWVIARFLGLKGGRQVGAVLVALALPYSLYTKYFMPEAWYFAPFLTAQAFLMDGLLRQRNVSLALSGISVAVLFFVKPHAIMVVGTSLLVIGLYSWKVKAKPAVQIRGASALVIGFFATRFFLNLILGAQSTFGAYGGFADNGLSSLIIRAREAPLTLVSQLAYEAGGHVLFLGFLYGLPLAAAALVLRSPAGRDERPAVCLALVALVNILVLMSLSIAWQVAMNPVGRIQMRYYGHAFSLLVLLLFARAPAAVRRSDRLAAAAMAAAFVVLGVLLCERYSDSIQFQSVVDGPDFAIVNLPIVGFAMIGAFALVSAGLLATGHRAWQGLAITSILVISIADAVIVTRMIGGAYNVTYTRGDEANFVDAVIPVTQRNQVLLVGRDQVEVLRFLFDYRGVPFVLYRAKNAALASSEVPAEVKWVITLGNAMTLGPKMEPVVSVQNLSIYRRVSARLARPPFAVHLMDHRLSFGCPIDFSENGDLAFYVGEGWSDQELAMRWTDGPIAVLRVRLEGAPNAVARKRIYLDFRAASFGASQQVVVTIDGKQVSDLQIVSEQHNYEITVDLDNPDPNLEHEIAFKLPDAHSPLSAGVSQDPRQLGISMSSMTFFDSTRTPGKCN